MPGMFITADDRVPIAADGEIDPSAITLTTDVIWIYPAMPHAVQQRVIASAVRMTQAKASKVARGKRAEIDTAYDVGAYANALLECNILDWQGPSFLLPDGSKRPCSPENVRALNPQMPLVARVLSEIGARNPGDEVAADDPNA